MTTSPPITAHLDAPVRARQHRGQLLHLLGRQREDVIDLVPGQEVVGVLAAEFLKFDINTFGKLLLRTMLREERYYTFKLGRIY